MKLRTHRRNVVVWRQSAGPGHGKGAREFIRLGRTGPIRRPIRIGALLITIGLMHLARAMRPRWGLLLSGGALTTVGLILRGAPDSVFFLLPGVLFLLSTPLVEAMPDADRARRSGLAHELAAYSTPAQRRDLEATLDRYPDTVTHELRDILASQHEAAGNEAAGNNEIPGAGRRY